MVIPYLLQCSVGVIINVAHYHSWSSRRIVFSEHHFFLNKLKVVCYNVSLAHLTFISSTMKVLIKLFYYDDDLIGV